MRLDEAMRLVPARPGRAALTFDEVVASGRPAVFEDFGDVLLFVDGRLFVLRDARQETRKEELPLELDTRRIPHGVGFETGWRHADGCACAACCSYALARAS
jgi:hypothetical protein